MAAHPFSTDYTPSRLALARVRMETARALLAMAPPRLVHQCTLDYNLAATAYADTLKAEVATWRAVPRT